MATPSELPTPFKLTSPTVSEATTPKSFCVTELESLDFSEDTQWVPLALAPRQPAQPICGCMYKKSPDFFRLRGWDWRYFIVGGGKISWWSSQANVSGRRNARTKQISSDSISDLLASDCAETSRRGVIDLCLSSCLVEADSTNPTAFTLRPRGRWAEGSTSDKNQDAFRTYVFDTAGSEHSRERWVHCIRQHMSEAEEARAAQADDASSARPTRDGLDDDSGSDTSTVCSGTEIWQDDSIGPDQAAAAKRLTMKLQIRDRGRR